MHCRFFFCNSFYILRTWLHSVVYIMPRFNNLIILVEGLPVMVNGW